MTSASQVQFFCSRATDTVAKVAVICRVIHVPVEHLEPGFTLENNSAGTSSSSNYSTYA